MMIAKVPIFIWYDQQLLYEYQLLVFTIELTPSVVVQAIEMACASNRTTVFGETS